MSDLGIKITVIIPVRNGEATLEKCFQSIKQQSIAEKIEIIVLNSMSTDNSRDIARSFGAKIIDIPNGTFNHGLTRNLGVQYATGEFIFMTVQDAWISESEMLNKMCSHFINKEIKAVVGHQAVPHEMDKDPLKWFKRFNSPKSVIRKIDDLDQFINSKSQEQQALIAWDNVVAMYRKEALLLQPFVKTDFAEDWVWSRQALINGWSLVYDSALVVYHYHHLTYQYAYKVAYALNYHLYKFFQFKPGIPNFLKTMAQATYHIFRNPALSVKHKMYWIFNNYKSALATFNSHVNFLIYLRIGGTHAIEKRYKKVCNIVPQGQQKL